MTVSFFQSSLFCIRVLIQYMYMYSTVHRHRMMWRRASACFHPFPVSEEKLAIYYKVFQASELQSRSFNLGIIIEHTAALSARCPTAPRYGCTVLRYRRCRIISNSDYSGISMFIVVHDEEPRWPGNGSGFKLCLCLRLTQHPHRHYGILL